MYEQKQERKVLRNYFGTISIYINNDSLVKGKINVMPGSNKHEQETSVLQQ